MRVVGGRCQAQFVPDNVARTCDRSKLLNTDLLYKILFCGSCDRAS